MAKNLKVIRLYTGEDVVAEVVEVTYTEIKIKDAARIMVIPYEKDKNRPGVALSPFTHWSQDKEFVLNKNLVLFMANPIKQFIESHTECFSGLIINEPQIIYPE